MVCVLHHIAVLLQMLILAYEAFGSPAPTVCNSLPDLSAVNPDLVLPTLSPLPTTGRVAPNTRCTINLGGVWEKRPAYFVLYVPPPTVSQIKGEERMPLVVDLPGNGGYHNQYGDVCTGKPENQSFGFGLTRGSEALVASVPFLHDDYSLAITWWRNKHFPLICLFIHSFICSAILPFISLPSRPSVSLCLICIYLRVIYLHFTCLHCVSVS